MTTDHTDFQVGMCDDMTSQGRFQEAVLKLTQSHFQAQHGSDPRAGQTDAAREYLVTQWDGRK